MAVRADDATFSLASVFVDQPIIKHHTLFLPDCAIVRALSTLMGLNSFNRPRIGHPLCLRVSGVAHHLGSVHLERGDLEASTFFGRYSDDALYFSTAQGLAQHQGYVLPSFPGRPLRPQVPIRYPLLLSGVWRLDPKFPENFVWTIRLTEGFGVRCFSVRFFCCDASLAWEESHR